MAKRILSELQKEYQEFFLGKLKEFGVKSPAELTKEGKRKFFTSIKQDWAKIKIAKRQTKVTLPKDYGVRRKITQTPFKEKPKPTFREKTTRERSETEVVTERPQTPQTFTKQIIESEPNEEQTDELKILYAPNNHFAQETNYCYPVVKVPKKNCSLKLPRLGRSSQRGYKENDFFKQLKLQITDLELTNNVHMVIPNYNKPYEPDIVIFDKKLNLYIDVEIDEPYDGYYRFPTHCIKFEEEQKQDDIRDLFFTESGWIVIRFTEKQVHQQSNECIDYLRNVINSIYSREFSVGVNCEIENQWEENQSIQWQKIHYREKYLGIDRFHKQNNYKEIQIDVAENEPIENVIQRTKKFNFEITDSDVAFDEVTHKYIHPKDSTGNAEYISVTTLIERFFPFDLKRYIERKAKEENRSEAEVLAEHLKIRDEAAEKGTFLHNQIENYLIGKNHQTKTKEFEMFLDFFSSELQKRNLVFAAAEKKIVSHSYNVAGTIDCLFKKQNNNEYVMLDWKRSVNLIIDDGNPKKYGYGYALSELNHLDNSSYYKYCLQQNIYKYIVEKEHAISISSMKLVVLHENYSKFYVVNVPVMTKEVKTILNSLKHKI